MFDPSVELTRRAEARVGALLKGKYRIEHLLGVGGMSAVYRAVHRNGNRVAVKILHPKVSVDVDVQRRFLQEGYAANNVGHPGVVRVLDDDTADDGSTFVVMELLEGETLGQRAGRSDGVLPHGLVMGAVHQLLDVLAAAEDKGIVHRDIKPDNIFITTDGAIKLLDFGIARMTFGPVLGKSTVDGSVFGTPGFMPPEQALGEKTQIDHQSDIWAVGATMFSLLSGRYVHEALTPPQHLLFAASRPARSLAAAAKDVPPAIVAIVDKALQFQKSDRWPSARAMQRAVEEAHSQLYDAPPPSRLGGAAEERSGGDAPPPSPASIAPTLKKDTPRRWRAIGVAAIGGAAILVAIGMAIGTRGGESSQATAETAAAASATTPPIAEPGPATSIVTTATATAPSSSAKAPAPVGSGGKRKPHTRPTGTKGAFEYQ